MPAVEYLDDLRKASSDDTLASLLQSAATPFDRPEWWDLLRRHCDLRPLYLLVRDGPAAALFPLTGADGQALTTLANWYTFRWRPLVTPGVDPAPLFEAAARALAARCWRVTLPSLPEEDRTATLLTAAFRRCGWITRCASHDSNHILHIGGRTYQDYQAGLPGRLRTTLKRKSGHVSCTVHDHFADDIWAVYQEIYQDSWKPEEGSPDFLRAFARAEGAAGRLRLGLATIDGQPVAAQFWTVEGGTAFIHKLAHRASARTHSPGTVLSAALFEHVIDSDLVDLIDFGTGDDPYKQDWMEDVRPRYRLEAVRPDRWRTWPYLARGLGRSALANLAPRPRPR
ncbi:MAG TPA: GNAT family N-acetyltransferase [Novosphingobium sp.]